MFWCSCGSEHIVTHDTLQDIIATTILESGAHLQWKVSHLLLHHTQWQIDRLITRNNIWTLVNIVISNPTCLDMVHHALFMIAHVKSIAIQENTWSYSTSSTPKPMSHIRSNNFNNFLDQFRWLFSCWSSSF